MFSKNVPDILNQICKISKYKWASPHPPGRDKPLLSFLLPPKIFQPEQNIEFQLPKKIIPPQKLEFPTLHSCCQKYIPAPKKIFLPAQYMIFAPTKNIPPRTYSCLYNIEFLLPQKYSCSHKNIPAPTILNVCSHKKRFLVWWRRGSYFSGSKLV